MLRHQPATLVVTVATLVLTIALYVVAPKGFFPVQDTGVILGISEAPEEVSFTAMAERQQALAREILKDRDVASLSSFIGVDGVNMTPNSGRIQINLKPQEERADALTIIRRLQTALARVDGIRLYMQPVQDLTVEDRVSRTQYQYAIQAADQRDDAQLFPADQQREDRPHPRRRQRGQDGERVDVALVEHAQHDVHGDHGGQDQDGLVGQRGLERLRRPLEAGPHRGRQAEVALDLLDGAHGVAERGIGGQIEGERHRGKLLSLIHI